MACFRFLRFLRTWVLLRGTQTFGPASSAQRSFWKTRFMGDLAECTLRTCKVSKETFGYLEFFLSTIIYPQDILGT